MKTASPWWVSLAFGLGLLLFLVSERLFGHLEGTHYLLTGIGIGAVIATTAARVWTTTATTGARRKVERTLLLCHIGALVAIVLYALSTKWGVDHFASTDDGAKKLGAVLTVLYAIVMAGSVIPLLMIELSLGVALRTNFDVHTSVPEDSGVELYRVREIGWSGLSIALASAFLMVTCSVSNQRNHSTDVSYFKTSSPGDSTVAIVQSSTEPIKVLLFFPDPNEVKDQVRDYFEALASEAGHIVIEEHDRFVDADLAAKYKVTFKDEPDKPKGMIVIARGKDAAEKSFTIEIDADLNTARKATGKLRNLDKEVNTNLMKLVREKRKAYILTGHGEMTNPESIPPELKGKVPEHRSTLLRKQLAELNYEVKDLGALELVHDVPDDATVVLAMAPSMPLQQPEWDALGRYLQRGGRLMFTLDPKADSTLGSLEGKLGVKFDPAIITDDQNFYPQRGNISDHRLVGTTQFSAHASTTSLSRSADKNGLILIDAGALEDVPFSKGNETNKKTVTIRTMDTSYLDYNDDMRFTADGVKPEKKQKYNIGVAVEGPKIKGPDGKDKDGFRALVYSDTQMFSDIQVQVQGHVVVTMLAGYLLPDSVKWLGGEEVFVGDVTSEDDKPISHTNTQDAIWFTLTIVGAPLLVLAIGLFGTMARRRKTTKKVEVTL
jgi:hypothetical protein